MVVIIKQEDVVPQKILVMKVKETVMGQVMGEAMMVIKDAKEILFAAVIIARDLAYSTMKKMTAVRNLLQI